MTRTVEISFHILNVKRYYICDIKFGYKKKLTIIIWIFCFHDTRKNLVIVFGSVCSWRAYGVTFPRNKRKI